MKNKTGYWNFASFVALMILMTGCFNNDGGIFGINPWVNYGSLKDIDGNEYRSILIGSQIWMVDNLTTTKLNDGTLIPVINDGTAWGNLSTPGCCWQNNDPPRKVTYGVLYNWYTVNTGKLCPTGWHVPSDEEWSELTTYLGGENAAAGKLKESGFKHWKTPNSGATNETYFWAYPGGDRLDGTGAFENLLEKGSWWTTTFGTNDAIIRSMSYNSINIQKSYYLKQMGLSVRCIKNF